MKRVVLGKTGLEVTRLGFGGICIQRVSEAQAVETVVHALKKGIDFIDTSRVYSNSEHRIGLALNQVGPEKKVVLASKSKSRTSDGLRKDLETSLRELQRDSIDIYQAHLIANEEDYEKVIAPGGQLEGMRKAQAEGLIGHVGLSSHSLDVVDRALDDNLFETVMVCYSFIEPLAAEKVIPKALSKGVGVLAMKPFSGGVIDRPDLALRYSLSYPDILVLAGVEHPSLVDQNWEIFGSGDFTLDPPALAEVEEIRQRWGKFFCRRCDYCLPCSEDIPIQTLLGTRSIVKRMGKQVLNVGWRQEGIAHARRCSKCGECMTRCPYHLPIPDLIAENLEYIDSLAKEDPCP
jgi:uncharacterized protein